MREDKDTNRWPAKEKLLSNQDFSKLLENLYPRFSEVLKLENIDIDLLSQFEDIYLPLAAWIAHKHTHAPVVIGINGAQGSGKSTLSKILATLLTHGFDKKVIDISIDDLYFSRQERRRLADQVHPLMQTRGVPGTHNVDLGVNLLSSLIRGESALPVMVPVFDKSRDDVLPVSNWRKISEPVDIILFEGWCVGALPQDMDELVQPINELEDIEDKHGVWRKYVNDQLSGSYQELYGFIDYLVMLKVPDMESVFEWRLLQEKKLKEKCVSANISTSIVMSESEVSQFIMHYERITRFLLKEMPERADILLTQDKQHQVCSVRV